MEDKDNQKLVSTNENRLLTDLQYLPPPSIVENIVHEKTHIAQ